MIKLILRLVFVLVILLSFKLNAQIKYIEKLLEKKEYEKAYIQLTKEYVSNSNNIEVLYMLANFYSNSKSLFKNYRLAYFYTNEIIPIFEQAVHDKNGRKILKWKKEGITLPSIRSLQKEIAHQALSEAKRINTVESYNNLIDFFSTEYDIVNNATRFRNAIAFYDAKSIDDIKAYESFIQTYPKSYNVKDAIRRKNNLLYKKAIKNDSINQLIVLQKNNTDLALDNEINKKINQWAFEEAMKIGTSKAIEQFLIHYSATEEYKNAFDSIEVLAFREETAEKTALAYFSFAEKNPGSNYYDTAIDLGLGIALKNKDIKATEYFLTNFQLHQAWDSAYLKFYNWFTFDGEPITINTFKKAYPDFPYKVTLENDLKLADNLKTISLNQPFPEKEFPIYADFIRLFMNKKISFVILQRSLENFIANKNKSLALQRLSHFEICFEDNIDYYNLKKMLNVSPNQNNDSKQLISTGDFSIQNAVLASNGKIFYFVLFKNGISGVYTSKKTKTGFDIPEKLVGLHSNDCPFWVSENETQMLFGRDGDIYLAENIDGYWISKGKLPYPINTPAYETDAIFTPDGKGILFVSDRKGSRNLQPSYTYFHGDTLLASDIYYSAKTDEGWSEPINLNINTHYCERFPVLASDMKTLFFSSDGYGGLGRSEIMAAVRSYDTSWIYWETPQNMSSEINTSGWDWNPAITPNGDLFYSVSTAGKNAKSLLYETKLKKNLFKNRIRTLYITINPQSDAEKDGIVYLIDLEKNDIIEKKQFSNAKNTEFTYLLYRKYGIFATKKGFISTSEMVYNDTSQNDIAVILSLYRTSNLVDSNKFINFPCIFFDSLSNLSKSAHFELQNLAEEIKTNNCGIEVHVSVSHSANAKECFDTSVKQAACIKNALLTEGVASDNIIAVGLGNTHNTNNIKIRLFKIQ